MSQILFGGDGYGENGYGEFGYGHPQRTTGSAAPSAYVYGQFGYGASASKLFLEEFDVRVAAPKDLSSVFYSFETAKLFHGEVDTGFRLRKVFDVEEFYSVRAETSNEKLIKILELI